MFVVEVKVKPVTTSKCSRRTILCPEDSETLKHLQYSGCKPTPN